MMPKIRVGTIPYLNGKPLIEGYEALHDHADFTFVPPSTLSRMLAEESLDIGLVSCVEYLRGNYEILPGVGVVSRGAVNSVLLTGTYPIEEARTVNLDPSSLTSCTLTALWYRYSLQRDPVFSRYPIGSKEALSCDAQLAIGDEGLFRSGKARYQMDLGAAWEEWIGHPFVYAAWLVRKGIRLGPAGEFLMSASDHSQDSLRELAEEASVRLGLDGSTCLRYLSHSLQFKLTREAVLGLETFLTMAVENHSWLRGIVTDLPPLGIQAPVRIAFHSPESCCQTAGS
jgi:chorismate dehydratase